MSTRQIRVFAATLLISGCAAAPPLPCTARAPACGPLDGRCVDTGSVCLRRDPGPTQAWVVIDSHPTPAAVYQDSRFIGYTPLKHLMGFTSSTGRIRLNAVPLYAGQAQQERVIALPPLPDRVTFDMNNPGRDTVEPR